MKKLILFMLLTFASSCLMKAETSPQSIVASFGREMSEWCKTGDITHRENIEVLCNGIKKCRVEDKIHADYQIKAGLTNYDTFVLDSYLNMFQTLMSQNLEFKMSNITIAGTDFMKEGELSFVKADINLSGSVNQNVTDLFLVRAGKITGIYTYSSQLGFSHLNGSLIRALETGRYEIASDPDLGIGGDFNGGFAKICNEAGNCGLIDTQGNIIVPCIWAEIFYYGGDFATGTDENGHIMKTYDLRFGGKIVPTINYFADGQTSNRFINGYMKAVSHLGGYYGFLKESDYEYSINYNYDWISDFCDGYALVGKNGNSFIIDKNFKVVLESTEDFEICGGFHDGLAKIKDKKSNLYGFIDLKKEIVIACQYQETDDFSDSLCAVYSEDGKRMGFINVKGDVIIPIVYEAFDGWLRWPHYFKDGYISIRKKLNSEIRGTLLGKNGKSLPGFNWQYSNVFCLRENKARFEKDGKYGFLNNFGAVVVPAKYDFASDYINGYASVEKDINGSKKWGAINHDGIEVIPCIYDNEVTFSNGIALVSLNGKIGLIDVYGNSSFSSFRR